MTQRRVRRAAAWLAAGPLIGAGLAAASPGFATDPARIAILPVVVHSASPDPGYVSQGIADMLAARLEQLGGLEVLRVDDPAAATSRWAPAVERGREAGADYVVYGSFTQFGDGASLDVQCAAVRGAAADPVRNVFIQSGAVGEIIPKLDQLADKLARFVGAKGDGSGTASAAPAAAAADPAELRELRERLDALERAVFPPVAGGASEPTPEPAPES